MDEQAWLSSGASWDLKKNNSGKKLVLGFFALYVDELWPG
jgi:hypothetical protein